MQPKGRCYKCSGRKKWETKVRNQIGLGNSYRRLKDSTVKQFQNPEEELFPTWNSLTTLSIIYFQVCNISKNKPLVCRKLGMYLPNKGINQERENYDVRNWECKSGDRQKAFSDDWKGRSQDVSCILDLLDSQSKLE